jgi:outer membrane murein-binding lipoprotein Lpp
MAARRWKTIALLLSAVLMLGGCLASKQVDSNSANISILANRTNNLKDEMSQVRNKVDKLVIQVTGLNEKLDAVSERRRAEPEEPQEPQEPKPDGERVDREVMLLEQELSIVERRLNDLETAKRAQVPSIKVLSGSTDLQPAKDMAAFLARNGFPVKAVDFASSAGYSYDTVYYSEGYEGHAQQIAETLGGRTVIKPLTWKSVFDIIAVKGELE